MRLEDAVHRIGEIHAQVLRGELFRGYRALPTAATGLVALAAAAAQTVWWPPYDANDFVRYWVGVCLICSALVGIDFAISVLLRSERLDPRRAGTVLLQFAPAAVVVGVLTYLWRNGPLTPVLPALWTACFGLGVLSSRPYLPRSIGFVAGIYLCGAAVLGYRASIGEPPSPWGMGLTFGIGQIAAALILYTSLERPERRASNAWEGI
ncbi:MAG: hypothetical protein AAF196_08705 [Planctomycetota bacterium]